MKEFTVCFTGHRKIAKAKIPIIAQALENEIMNQISKGKLRFALGGALGFDTLSAQSVLKCKERFPDIELILVLPCRNQTEGWNNSDKIKYEEIKKQASQIIFISDEYTDSCMHERNRKLVDLCSLCICYLTNKRSGTHFTVSYATKQNVPVINIAELIGNYPDTP